MKGHEFLLSAISGVLFFSPQVEANVPHLTLANIYHTDIRLSDYYVSEKFDGIRAYWDGTHLYSRQGTLINAPSFFLKKLPEFPVDGELWLGRGRFQELLSILRASDKTDRWEELSYQIFDAPKCPGNYDRRLLFLQKNVRKVSRIEVVKQFKVLNEKDLYKKLKEVEAVGGEGLVLHQISGDYLGTRSDQLLKLKSYVDDEAVILGIEEGKGKYQGMMGALWVKSKNGLVFKIGSGFSDDERKNPPQIGDVLTYRYNGKTEKGIPKFARFLRMRDPSE